MSFIPYQVDYTVQNVSKTLGFSKKKIVFKFGFASPIALENGSVGAACRGSEHDITFIWSLSSGKRQLYLDGKEIHYSESGQNGWTADRTWQFAFPLRDTTLGARHTLKVHFITQPVNRDIPDSRPFDMRIAGISYFQFNQIFQLGTNSMVIRGGEFGGGHRYRVGNTEDDVLSADERRMIAQAKLESLKDLEREKERENERVRALEEAIAATKAAAAATTSTSPAASKNNNSPLSREEGSLIDFGEPVQPQAIVKAAAAARAGQANFMSEVSMDSAIAPNGNRNAGPGMPPPNNYGYNNYGPPPQAYPQQQGQLTQGGPSPYGVAASPYAVSTPAPFSYAPAPAASTPAPAPFTYGPAPAPGALTVYQPSAGQPAPSPYAVAPSPYSYGAAAPPSASTNNYTQASSSMFGGAQQQQPAVTSSFGAGPANPFGNAPAASSSQQQQQQPFGNAQQSFGSAANPFASSSPSPYAAASPNPFSAPAPYSNAATPSPFSAAPAPYNNASTSFDPSTSFGASMSSPYGPTTNNTTSTPYGVATTPNNASSPYNMMSPGAQSYGSLPTFAQPPRQQQQQQQMPYGQQQSGYY